MPETMMQLLDVPATTTEVLADYVCSVRYEDLPVEVIDRVTRQCVDIVGVALAGVREDAPRAIRRLHSGGVGDSSIWGSNTCASPADAAFANAAAAHALDFDDMWLPGSHPSAPIVPAAFAVAETLNSSGRELLAALTVGYEVMGRLHSAVSGRFGWHPTAVFGTFGAAPACGRLLELSPRQMCMAFGVASSMTGGIDGHSGTMTKPLHAGLGAQSGVRSALLAADGFTASGSAFEGSKSFFDTYFPSTTVQTWRLTADLGRAFYIVNPGVGIKMYPAGYYMHQTFEATLQIVEQHDLHESDIAGIRIGNVVGHHFDRPRPQSSLDAKFSLQYMAVMAVLYRQLTVESFDTEVVFSDAVGSLLARIDSYFDKELSTNPDIESNPVRVTCHDGRIFEGSVTTPRSHWRYPLSREAWVGKFRTNASRRLSETGVDGLLTALEGLRDDPDVREVGAHMRTNDGVDD